MRHHCPGRRRTTADWLDVCLDTPGGTGYGLKLVRFLSGGEETGATGPAGGTDETTLSYVRAGQRLSAPGQRRLRG